MKVCDKFSIHEKIEQLIDNEIEKKLIDGDEYELIVSLLILYFKDIQKVKYQIKKYTIHMIKILLH